MGREARLIIEGSPCNVNYFDRNLLTVKQAVEQGLVYCQNRRACEESKTFCTLKYGLEVAKYVIKGSTLKKEIYEFLDVPFIDEKFWDSENGWEFLQIKGKALALRAVERFANTVLLNDNKSAFPICEKCSGIELEERVLDSIHEDPESLSGSGKTRERFEQYCPTCDPKPRGKIINEDPAKEIAEEMKIFGPREKE